MKATRYGPGGDGHINHTRLVVIDNHTDGAGLLGSPGLCLVIGAAPLYDGDFSPDIQAQIVFLRAGTGDHDVRQRPVGQAAEGIVPGDGAGFCVIAVIIANIPPGYGDVGGENAAVFHAGNGQGLGIGGRLAGIAVVRVGGQRAAAVTVVVGGAVVVAHSHGHGNAGFPHPVEHLHQIHRPRVLGLVFNEAAGGAQAHVHGVYVQSDAVFQAASTSS